MLNPLPALDTPIARLLTGWPQLVPLFLERRMSCVGCLMARFDTVQDAARSYGLDPELFLVELRAAAQTPPTQPS